MKQSIKDALWVKFYFVPNSAVGNLALKLTFFLHLLRLYSGFVAAFLPWPIVAVHVSRVSCCSVGVARQIHFNIHLILNTFELSFGEIAVNVSPW